MAYGAYGAPQAQGMDDSLRGFFDDAGNWVSNAAKGAWNSSGLAADASAERLTLPSMPPTNFDPYVTPVSSAPVPPQRPAGALAQAQSDNANNGITAAARTAPPFNQVRDVATADDTSVSVSPLAALPSDQDYPTLSTKDITGKDPNIQSALQRHQQEVTDAATQKSTAIQKAMDSLAQAKQGQSINLPLLAWGSALMGPTQTGSFGEALSNASHAAMPVAQAQREKDLAYQQQMGQLGISAADVEVQRAHDSAAQFQAYLKQIEDNNYRATIQEQNNEYRKTMGQAAKANAASRAVSAQAQASKSETYQDYIDGKSQLSPATDSANLRSLAANAPDPAMRAKANMLLMQKSNLLNSAIRPVSPAQQAAAQTTSQGPSDLMSILGGQ